MKTLVPVTAQSDDWNAWKDEVHSCCSVAIHVRRGDYVRLGWSLSMEYYNLAIQRIREELTGDVSLFVFSDDLDLCRRYFAQFTTQYNVYYPEYESDHRTVDDLLLMSHCMHNIIANSSYSWWAGWLNANPHKIVIAPEAGMWTGDFYPESWILLPGTIIPKGQGEP